jgi:hypothetical protein
MFQVPIEEVLAEYRKKYSAEENISKNNPETVTESGEEEKMPIITPEAFAVSRLKRERRGNVPFLRIVVFQAVAAAAVLAVMAATRLLNPELYSQIISLFLP